METEREWQFIKNELMNRTTTKGNYKDEWHIGGGGGEGGRRCRKSWAYLRKNPDYAPAKA